MSWQLQRLARKCWFCPTVIEPGDLARLGVNTPAVWCVACAKTKLGETPPADVLDPPAPHDLGAPVTAPPAPEPLFALEPDGAKFKHADARLALEQLRARITPADGAIETTGGES